MCGEKQHHVTVKAATLGSPPHVRGKAGQRLNNISQLGITPACAGKSSIVSLSASDNGDHPRMCGEKSSLVVRGFKTMGSPPHVRGKEQRQSQTRRPGRITPACAGKRCATKRAPLQCGDHPRMCGEKRFPAQGWRCKAGSPPHVRGKGQEKGYCAPLRRITPACAGKRLKRSRSIVPHAAIVPLFPSVCNKPAGSDGSPAGHDAPPFLPIENAAPASPAYNLRSL